MNKKQHDSVSLIADLQFLLHERCAQVATQKQIISATQACAKQQEEEINRLSESNKRLAFHNRGLQEEIMRLRKASQEVIAATIALRNGENQVLRLEAALGYLQEAIKEAP